MRKNRKKRKPGEDDEKNSSYNKVERLALKDIVLLLNYINSDNMVLGKGKIYQLK